MNPEELQAEAALLEAELQGFSQPQQPEATPEQPTLEGQVTITEEAKPEKQDGGFDLLGLLGDLGTAILGGVRNAIHNTGGAIHDLAGGDNQPALVFQGNPDFEQRDFDVIPGLVGYASPGKVNVDPIIQLPETPQPKTIAGQMTQGVVQFGTGFVGGGRALQGLGWAKNTLPLLRAGTAGAVSDFSVFNEQEERLSNLVEEFPALHNPVTDYLAADPNDTAAEGRFKNVLEGVLTGGATDLVFKAVRQLKHARFLRKAAGDAAAAKHLADNVDEVDKVLKKTDQEVLDDIFPKEPKPVTAELKPEPLPRNTKALTDEQLAAYRKQIKTNKPVETLIDFNADTMVSGKEVKHVLDTLSEVNREEMFRLKGGKQSLEAIQDKAFDILSSEAKDVADLLGTDANDLMTALARDARSIDEQASRLVAGKHLMQSTARKIHTLSLKIDNGVGTDKDQIELLRHIDILADLEANLKAIQTGSARTTSAGRIRTGDILLDEEIGQILDQVGGSDNVRKLARRIKGAGKDGGMRGVLHLVRKSWGEKLVDVHNEVWMNAILSGPKTHAVNVLSTGMNTLFLPGERILGGALSGNKDIIIEGATTYYGLFQALGDSLNMAWRSFQMEDNVLDPLGRIWDADSRKAITARNFNLKEGSMLAHGVNWLGNLTRLSSRFLLSEDEFFKQLNYRASVRAKAVREGLSRGLTGEQLAGFVEDSFRQAFDAQGKGVDLDPLKYAREATFTQELTDDTFLGALGNTIQRGVNRHPLLGRAIFPFVRVPTNLLQFVSDRTPFIAPLTKQFRADILAGGDRRAVALGKVATGSMIYTYATMLAMNGKLTGSGPGDPTLRKQLMNTGWRPYSFVNTLPDGTKEYIPFNRTDPFGMFFGLVGDFAQTAGQQNEKENEDLATAMVLSLANNINNKTYFKGLIDLLSVFGWNNYNQQGSARHLVESRLTSYIPNALAPFRNDPYLRETRSWLDRINNKLGFGLSRGLDPKRNMFGEAILIPPGYGPLDVQPFTSAKSEPDMVLDELAELSRQGITFTLPANKIAEGRIDLTQFRNPEGQSAADRRRELMGVSIKGRPTLKTKFQQLIESDKYQQASEGQGDFTGGKATMLKRLYEKYKQAALVELLQEDYRNEAGQTLMEAFRADRQQKIQVLRNQQE